MRIHQLYHALEQEIIDYNQLIGHLKSYAHPRGKINQWLKDNSLIRVKKGLYVFGPTIRQQPFSIETLANLIYGPSAISLQYALSFYQLIPERTYVVTSITNKRNKQFKTPVGDFHYRYLHPNKYAIGINLIPHQNSGFLMASPEKALCDTIALTMKHLTLSSQSDFLQLIHEDMRLDPERLKKINFTQLNAITQCYHQPILDQFTFYLNQWNQ